MCPIVPTFTCGFERSNFSFAIKLPKSLSSLVLPVTHRGAGTPAPAPKLSPSYLLALRAADDFVGNHARRLFVARKLHRIRRPTLRGRTNLVHVAEHFLKRHHRPNHLRTGSMLHAFD